MSSKKKIGASKVSSKFETSSIKLEIFVDSEVNEEQSILIILRWFLPSIFLNFYFFEE